MKDQYYFRIILISVLIQFINVFDFMVIIPLGPLFVSTLNIDPSYIGYLTGSYTLAATLSALFCARYLDRFNRKIVLMTLLLGLSIGTLLTCFAFNMQSLLMIRIVSGLFAGPLIGVIFAIVIDRVNAQQRGRAIATIMGTFTVVSVFAIPLSLKVINHFPWQVIFATLFILGMLTLYASHILLPTMPINNKPKDSSTLALLRHKGVKNALLLLGCAVFSTFLIIPSIAIYLTHVRHIGYSSLSVFYFVAGIVSFIAMQLIGRINNIRYRSQLMLFISTMIILLLFTEFMTTSQLPAFIFFTLFMCFTASRTVMIVITNSDIAPIELRAGFGSVQSATQHFASGIAGIVASLLLSQENGTLSGLNFVAGLSIIISLIIPLLYFCTAPSGQNSQQWGNSQDKE